MSLESKQANPKHAVEQQYQKDKPQQEQEPTGLEHQMYPKPDYGVHSYNGLNRLQGKVALVTGGDSGIGRAVCLAFAREGSDVVCAYHSSDADAQETKHVVEQAGKHCLLLKADLSEDSGCKEIVDKTVASFGRIDILVNNAAYQGKLVEDFLQLDHERVLHTFKTNIIAMFSLCRYSIPHIPEGGSIINTASIQAYKPSSGLLDYAATKGAIVNFTKGLATSLLKKGIRVNCVAPGPVWTPLVVSSFPADKSSELGKDYPIERAAQPVEISPAFVFLASQESRYVAGEILAVTGGTPTM